MIDFFVLSLCVGCAAAFAILFLKRVGFVEYMQVRGSRLAHGLFSCDFCLSFWTCLAMCAALSVACGEPGFLAFSVVSTVVCRRLL